MKKCTVLSPLFIIVIAICFQYTVTAQELKTTTKDFKNTIHFNITNPIIFGGRSFIFGYERVINKHQTFSINFGTVGFPSLGIINSDSFKVKTIRDDKGYNLSVDYRFYLAKENKYAAPHGVYIGPYYSYNYFDKKHVWAINSSTGFNGDVETDLSLKIHTIGAELGYQFILWKRVTLDMILMGPGIASYNLKASLGSNLSAADREKLFEKLNAALADKFPGYNVIINDGDFQKKGTAKTTSFGFRYLIQVGFRF